MTLRVLPSRKGGHQHVVGAVQGLLVPVGGTGRRPCRSACAVPPPSPGSPRCSPGRDPPGVPHAAPSPPPSHPEQPASPVLPVFTGRTMTLLRRTCLVRERFDNLLAARVSAISAGEQPRCKRGKRRDGVLALDSSGSGPVVCRPAPLVEDTHPQASAVPHSRPRWADGGPFGCGRRLR